MKTKKQWTVDVHPDGTETWTSLLGFSHTKKPAWFPLPEPLASEDDLPEEIADRLPNHDLDPPYPDEPLPEPPPLTDAEYEDMEHARDTLDAFGIGFRQYCNQHYDEARATGLVP